MKLVGIKRVKGTFNDRPYDNYNLYVTDDNSDGVIFGDCPRCIKVKADIMHSSVPEEDLKKLKNIRIDFYYNAYKNVVKVIVG